MRHSKSKESFSCSPITAANVKMKATTFFGYKFLVVVVAGSVLHFRLIYIIFRFELGFLCPSFDFAIIIVSL